MPGLRFSALLLLWVALLTLFQHQPCAAEPLSAKTVAVALQTNWAQTPLILEASEFFHSEDPKLFWKFAELASLSASAAAAAADPAAATTQQQQYESWIDLMAPHVPVNSLHTLKFGLALRYFSPIVQMHRQLASTLFESAGADQAAKIFACGDAFVDVGDRFLCPGAELQDNIKQSLTRKETAAPGQQLEIFDHVYPGNPSAFGAPERGAVLYAMLGTATYAALHPVMLELTRAGFQCVLRHYDSAYHRHTQPQSLAKVGLSGFGIELALKSVEYKAMDDSKVEAANTDSQEDVADEGGKQEDVHGFLFPTLNKRRPDLKDELAALKASLQNTDERFDRLKVWHLKDLGFQSAQHILQSDDPLRAMRDISQNFPSAVVRLTKLKVNATLRDAIVANEENMPAGLSQLFINGRFVDPNSIDALGLFEVVREEARKAAAVERVGVPVSSISRLLRAEPPASAALRFAVQSPAIVWVNNLERDMSYSRWPRTVGDFLFSNGRENLVYVARNFFTVVVVLDPANAASLEVASTLARFLRQQVPQRVGILLHLADATVADGSETTLPQMMARVTTRMSSQSGEAALWFLAQCHAMNQHYGGGPLTADIARASFQQIGGHFGIHSGWDQVAYDSSLDSKWQAGSEYAHQLGFSGASLPVAFVNGILCPGPADQLGTQIVAQHFSQVDAIRALIRDKTILDSTEDIYSVLLQPRGGQQVFRRFSSLVSPSASRPVKFLGLESAPLAALHFVHNPDRQDALKTLSLVVVADLSTLAGVQLAHRALQHLRTDGSDVRVAVASHTACFDAASCFVERALLAGLKARGTAKKGLRFVELLLEQRVSHLTQHPSAAADPAADLAAALKVAAEAQIKVDQWRALMESEAHTTAALADTAALRAWFAGEAGLSAGQAALIANGRIIALSSDEAAQFSDEDFSFLDAFEGQRHANYKKIVEDIDFVGNGVDPDDLTADFLADKLMRVGSVLGSVLADDSSAVKSLPSTAKSSVELGVEDGNPLFSIDAVLDPLSKAAQRVSPMLMAILARYPTRIRLFLVPQPKVSELPIKSYYRYAIADQPQFTTTGELQSSRVVFKGLPSSRLFTMAPETPAAWLLRPVVARYDLDNIRLDTVPDEDKSVFALYELEHILVEGNCMEMTNRGMPPRGLQLVLGTPTSPHMQDTIVMSNFGYFQLKGNPGVWTLNLAAGRSETIMRVLSASRSRNDVDSTGNGDVEGVSVVQNSFKGEFLWLRVGKRPGQEHEEVLAAPDDERGSSLGDLLRFSKGAPSTPPALETIHIFSVASGHLYERFLKIMMLSVIRNTKNPVKFWVVQNFVSPKFLEFIPSMAARYNFEIGFVTYKWPAWLHQQTEKQRIIWGYKILFLDVLFPLNVTKIIFVDADQVVRADMRELWEMDLQGAPYAYVPFCMDRKETDGFRFWKSGYWHDHLRGLPYHISALYVVDLVRFRRQASGDQLRATYDSLSGDPNSLANLDQDLPNFLQHQVRIHSLPQEWLWCQTWCSDESKGRAKTIDLCNNPLTKTPKLTAAVQIVSEWTELDQEVKALEAQTSASKSSQQQQQRQQQQQQAEEEQPLRLESQDIV